MNSSLTKTETTTATSLHELNAKRFTTIRQIGKQSQIENNFVKIDNSILNASSTIRAQIENIDSFETRLRNLHGNFKQENGDTADEEVNRELNISTSRRAILYSQHLKCPYCMKQIRREYLDDHTQMCKYKFDSNNITTFHNADILAVRPHPLRNLKLVDVSFDSIRIRWDVPIFEGGEPLTDFEVSYCCASMKIYDDCRKEGKKKVLHKRMSCLWFCNRKPLKGTSFIIEGLSASVLHLGIKIRCKNVAGWSDYSEALEAVKTKGTCRIANLPS